MHTEFSYNSKGSEAHLLYQVASEQLHQRCSGGGLGRGSAIHCVATGIKRCIRRQPRDEVAEWQAAGVHERGAHTLRGLPERIGNVHEEGGLPHRGDDAPAVRLYRRAVLRSLNHKQWRDVAARTVNAVERAHLIDGVRRDVAGGADLLEQTGLHIAVLHERNECGAADAPLQARALPYILQAARAGVEQVPAHRLHAPITVAPVILENGPHSSTT